MADNSTIFDDFKSVPVEYLIATPFTASAKAQTKLADDMLRCVNALAYGKDSSPIGNNSDSDQDSGKDNKVQTLPMKFEKPIIHEDGNIETQTVHVDPPLLGLVPLPALLIDDVTANFTIKLNHYKREKSHTHSHGQAGGGVSGILDMFDIGFHAKGSVTHEHHHTDHSTHHGKYHVTATARQQSYPQGMQKLLDMLADSVTPTKLEDKGQ